MEQILVQLKALADESRLKIVRLLLTNDYCVGKLAKELELTEAAISQHLRVLRGAGLIDGEKRGYFMHYDVKRDVLEDLAEAIRALAKQEKVACDPEKEQCAAPGRRECHSGKKPGQCSEEVRLFCHGHAQGKNHDEQEDT